MTREHGVSVHEHIQAVGFNKRALWNLNKLQKCVVKEMGAPDVCTDPDQRNKGIPPTVSVCTSPENVMTGWRVIK